MPEFFSSDGPYYLQFLVVFLVILVFLMGIVLLLRGVAGRRLSMSARRTDRARQPRLGIVDIYELDGQRQLILLRRDNVEHLLLVGGPNDVVVERNVVPSAGARPPSESVMRSAPSPDMDFETGAQIEPRSLGAPAFEMPMVVPLPTPGTSGHENGAVSRPPPLDPALFEPEASPVDRTSAEPAKSRIGISRIGRILRRAPPPLTERRPDVSAERTAPETAPALDVPPSLMSSGSPRPLDPAALSDMAHQLETALRRQSSGVTPPPGPTSPDETPEDLAPTPPAPTEPAIAQTSAGPSPSFPMGRANPVPSPPAQAPESVPEPDPIAAAMAEAVPPPLVAPKPPPKPAPEAPSPASGTPLTVEEIETEFARLLGRPLDKS